MDIALAFDEDYVDHARVAVETVLEAHAGLCPVTVWLLTPVGVSRERGDELRAQAAGRGRIHVLETDDAFRGLPRADEELVSYISAGMYLRLLLPSLLPRSVSRYLYLDADTLCLGDLRPLWRLDLAGAPLAAVGDAFTLTCDGIPGADHRIDPRARYFNSGVLLVDPVRWRRLQISEQCFRYIDDNKGQLRFPDQDALNIAAHGNWLRLGREWNHMRGWRLEPGHSKYVPGERWPRVMHFAGPWKPWYRDFRPGLRRDRYTAVVQRLGLPVPAYDDMA
ncbi:glycosyltransferase family 8 protein [Micromonospora sp. DT227]|uniref:glycosyltransferase family 8 protein n=1 Tax=Micromonospora sp. DT227 TaxID=3393433 RepID=UPI003CF20626